MVRRHTGASLRYAQFQEACTASLHRRASAVSRAADAVAGAAVWCAASARICVSICTICSEHSSPVRLSDCQTGPEGRDTGRYRRGRAIGTVPAVPAAAASPFTGTAALGLKACRTGQHDIHSAAGPRASCRQQRVSPALLAGLLRPGIINSYGFKKRPC